MLSGSLPRGTACEGIGASGGCDGLRMREDWDGGRRGGSALECLREPHVGGREHLGGEETCCAFELLVGGRAMLSDGETRCVVELVGDWEILGVELIVTGLPCNGSVACWISGSLGDIAGIACNLADAGRLATTIDATDCGLLMASTGTASQASCGCFMDAKDVVDAALPTTDLTEGGRLISSDTF